VYCSCATSLLLLLLLLALTTAAAAAAAAAVSALEKELAGLIVDGQITARIDSQAKVLYAR
jgi:hypothetical protein